MIESKLSGNSLDIVNENILKIKELFPEIVNEDKIDFDKLKLVLGENVDDSEERYNFTWWGKREALRESQKTSNGTLNPCKSESKNWDSTQNLYIEGDNLEVLKILQKSYYNKVKMIYIDPPYNTGKDFIYPDNYKDNLENYLEITNQITAGGGGARKKLTSNPETNGRFHSNWLNMMYPRLKLARNLLNDDGVIFISIDDNEIENLKKLCNEIFGEDNFIGQLNWYKSQTPPNLSFKLKKNIEYILIYEKIRNNKKYKGLKKTSKSDDPLTKPQNSIKILEFKPYSLKIKLENQIIKKGVYGTKKYPNELLNDLVVQNNTNKNTVIFKNRFIWLQDKLNHELKNGTVVNLSKNLVLSYKKSEYENEVPKNFIDAETGDTTENAGKYLQKLFRIKVFDYPKPYKLINYLISFLDNNDDDIYLDFFSGSATTAEAIMQSNLIDGYKRKFVMVQLPELTDQKSDAFKSGFKNICEMGKERIRRVGDKILEESDGNDLDVGFKVFKLDSSNLTKWNPDYDNLEDSLLSNADNIVSGRSELDLVYEVMLKYGIDLSVTVDEIEIDDKKVYNVGFGALFVCLDDNLTVGIADELVDLINDSDSSIIRVVFKDNGFISDSDKANVKETLRASNVDEFITI